MLCYISIDPGGETLVDSACVSVEQRIFLDRDAINALRSEVAIHAVATKPLPVFTAGAQQAERHARSVVLQLDIGEGIRGCPKVLGADMGNTICGPENLDLSTRLAQSG